VALHLLKQLDWRTPLALEKLEPAVPIALGRVWSWRVQGELRFD